MNVTGTLSRYFGRQFLMWFCLLLFVLLLLIYLIDTVELLRRAAGKPEVTLGLVLRMGLFKLPGIGQQIIPFAVLFSAMFTFWRLTRSNELVVARAAGISVWQFLSPVLAAAILVGVVKVTVVNPVGALLIAEFNRLEERYLKGHTSSFDVSGTGLWLRQANGRDHYLMHAMSIEPDKAELKQILLMRFQDNDRYVARIDAASARLLDGRWEIRDGWMRQPNRPPRRVAVQEIPTELTLDRIEESFAPPETISFWALPRFIQTMEATGFSAIRHRLHFQSLLSQPFLYCAMVLLAAAFSMRQTRRGGALAMVSVGVTTGFVLFIVTDIVLSLGVTESIPALMAAWTPAAVSLLLGATALFHLEDG
ncbi:MAG: LPS export ABC transporter permease LptG [Azospirillum sp.]|nr:LPS export ABC transporter permease LptG [Azospirillum sp.]